MTPIYYERTFTDKEYSLLFTSGMKPHKRTEILQKDSVCKQCICTSIHRRMPLMEGSLGTTTRLLLKRKHSSDRFQSFYRKDYVPLFWGDMKIQERMKVCKK
jgi:hypothetical protein